MGLRSAAMACQRSTAAVPWIYAQSGRKLFNYLDDFIGVSLFCDAERDCHDLQMLLESLSLEESKDKACLPSTVMTCLGVDIDTVAFTLSITPSRLYEIETLLDTWLSKKSATKTDLQSLVGKLVFVSRCVRPSRVFISRILELLRSAKFNHHHIRLNSEFRKDLQRWSQLLVQLLVRSATYGTLRQRSRGHSSQFWAM